MKKNNKLKQNLIDFNSINISIKNDLINLYCKFAIKVNCNHVVVNSNNVSFIFEIKMNSRCDLYKELNKFKNKNFKFFIKENYILFSFIHTIPLNQFKKMKSKIINIEQYNNHITMNIIIDLTKLPYKNIDYINKIKSAQDVNNIDICHNPKPYQGGKFSDK